MSSPESLSADAQEAVRVDAALALGGIHRDLPGESIPALFEAAVALVPFPARAMLLRETLLETLLAREEQASTSLGEGLAIPHPNHPRDWGLGEPLLALHFLQRPLAANTTDGQPLRVLLLLLCRTVRGHLRLLSLVSHLLQDHGFRALLNDQAKDAAIIAHVRRVAGSR